MAKQSKDEKWDGEERRARFDHNAYARITSGDNFSDIGVFRVSPKIYKENNGFCEPAWIYDRRDKRYKDWRDAYLEREIEAIIKGAEGDLPESKVREIIHQWDSSDLLEGMHIG